MQRRRLRQAVQQAVQQQAVRTTGKTMCSRDRSLARQSGGSRSKACGTDCPARGGWQAQDAMDAANHLHLSLPL